MALLAPAGLGMGDVKLAALIWLVLGWLGWPVVDETSEGALVYSDFEHGRIKIEDRAIQVIDRAR